MIERHRPSLDRFRATVRTWLAEEGPEALLGTELYAFGQDVSPIRADPSALEAWEKALHAAGYMCASWPVEFGGAGLTIEEQVVVTEEFARARLPRLTRDMGESLVGPSIMVHGTDEQKERLLPRIVSGDDRYCQGFSEPNAGSDLAGLAARGRVDGNEVRITGQKIWTSGFDRSNMIFCLCRTEPGSRLHGGISFVLVPTHREDGEANGIEFRPIRQLTEYRTFAETFFDDARASLDDVIGGLGNGWKVAMTTLGFERSGAITQHLAFARELRLVVDAARERGRLGDPVVRQQLARAHTTVELMRIRGQQLMGIVERGGDPSALDPTGSISKIQWSEHQRWVGELAVDLLGPEALLVGDGYALTPLQELFLVTRSHTIWGGSSEVQRNILAERWLGLPKEPRP